jgi:copper chaperone
METKKFKTNIKCTGCLATVTPYLNETVGEANWNVDITDPSKILSVTSGTNEAKIVEAVQKAGFKIEKV